MQPTPRIVTQAVETIFNVIKSDAKSLNFGKRSTLSSISASAKFVGAPKTFQTEFCQNIRFSQIATIQIYFCHLTKFS